MTDEAKEPFLKYAPPPWFLIQHCAKARINTRRSSVLYLINKKISFIINLRRVDSFLQNSTERVC